MRGLDGKARIFIGSSSEGKTAADTIASALETAGMRPLPWWEFFKTRDLPLQELDRRMADADGAILVGSADDRGYSRGTEFDQMRDNVLFEYGLFAGHLGRHRCILLMPDQPRFRVPSDLLGVAGFELYTDQTLSAVARRVPERLKKAFAGDGFKPPSLQERCRRLLLLSGWARGEIAKIRLELPNRSLKEQLGEKIEAVLCFLNDDIDELELREDADALEELVKDSIHDFPNVPDRREVEHQLRQDVRDFLSHPQRHHLPSQIHDDRSSYDLEDLLGSEGFKAFDYARRNRVCPWCSADRGCRYGEDTRYVHAFSFRPIRGFHYRYLEEPARCDGHGWYMGAVDMLACLHEKLGEFDRTISDLERWQQDWVPSILDRLAAMERTVHEQIFGHL